MENVICQIKTSGDTLTAELRGAIDHHTARELRESIDSAITDCGAKKLILELSGIEFMDSAGLGLILGRFARMKDAGGSLTLRNPTDAIMRILRLAGADKFVRTEKTGINFTGKEGHTDESTDN